MLNKITDVVNQRIRPYLQSHGGDIEVLELKDHVLTVRLSGQCSDCPSAMYSTRQIILNEICEQIPFINDVKIEQYTSPELLDMARSLLSHAKES